jgi:hypothetical protein
VKAREIANNETLRELNAISQDVNISDEGLADLAEDKVHVAINAGLSRALPLGHSREPASSR